MSETILVAGGAGFIGSHLAADAVAEGHRVVVLDDLSTGHRENVPADARFVHGSILDDDLPELLRDEGVTVVLHYAAQANVRTSVDDPLLDARVNVVGSLQLIQACRRAGVRRFLFASSGGTVYGEQDAPPCDEDHPTRPLSPYGCSKLAVEEYLLAYHRLGDLEPVVLRYANVYGSRQDPAGEAGIVAILAEKFLRGERPIIYGDGGQTRDYVHVDDVVAIDRRILERWVPGVFNVGTGVETPLVDLYRAIEEELGVDVPPRNEPPVPGELRRSSLDPARLEATFGIGPVIGLADGLARTLPFYREKLAASEGSA